GGGVGGVRGGAGVGAGGVLTCGRGSAAGRRRERHVGSRRHRLTGRLGGDDWRGSDGEGGGRGGGGAGTVGEDGLVLATALAGLKVGRASCRGRGWGRGAAGAVEVG